MCARDRISVATATSMLHLKIPHPGVEWIIDTGSMLPLQRNFIVQHMKGDWLLFIDSDMVFQPDALVRLLKTRQDLLAQGDEPDIVGALCFRRSPPHNPTLFRKDESGHYQVLEDYAGHEEVVEVDATGMAFALISMSAFDKITGMPMPPYEERIGGRRPPEFFRWHGMYGEDVRFCSDLRDRGGHIYVDTSVKIGHMYEHAIGESEWRTQLERTRTGVGG